MKKKLKEVLLNYRINQKSVMAFNLQNFYQLEAATHTAVELKLPIIIQFSERFLRFLDKKYTIKYILNRFSSDYTYFHLDHCIDIDFIKYCVDAKFDSVMYDGSAFDINTNIFHSKILQEYATKKGCLLEGELGKVSGVEDGFGGEGSSYAKISEIKKYVKETKIDLMALGIGNAHGFYETLDGLNLNILKESSEQLPKEQLFVLHGGTGLPKDIIKQAIGYGVVKINVSTQLKQKTIETLKLYLSKNELYNEISFNELMTEEISKLFKEYLINYTK